MSGKRGRLRIEKTKRRREIAGIKKGVSLSGKWKRAPNRGRGNESEKIDLE